MTTAVATRTGWDAVLHTLDERAREIIAHGDPEELEELGRARRAVAHLKAYDERRRRDADSRTESPIERAFLTAVTASGVMTAQPQVQIGRYRVDFVCRLTVPGHPAKVVVELDGHAFHERTAAQAARDKRRDRELLAAGYPVMRFTGAEIHADVDACVREVHRQLLGIA